MDAIGANFLTKISRKFRESLDEYEGLFCGPPPA